MEVMATMSLFRMTIRRVRKILAWVFAVVLLVLMVVGAYGVWTVI